MGIVEVNEIGMRYHTFVGYKNNLCDSGEADMSLLDITTLKRVNSNTSGEE